MKRIILVCILVFCFMSILFCSDNSGKNKITIFRWDFDISGNDEIGKLIENKFDVKIETITVPWTGWSDRLNTMVASGSVPDIFVGYGIMDIQGYTKWIEDDVLLPISDYVTDDYPNLKSYIDKWDDQRINDKVYSLPVESYVDHVLFVRSGWLEEIDMNPPKTVEDFYNVAIAFKEKYNIYPFSSSAPHTAGLFWMNMFFYAYGSSWNDWDKLEDGSYVPSWISNGAKEAARFMKKLYDEGLLDPDFVTNSDSIKKEKFMTGKIGMMMHGEYDLIKNSMKDINPSAEFIVLPPVKGFNGQGMWGLNGYFSAVMISSKVSAEKRKKILQLFDYLYSNEGIELMTYGIENIHYKIENDNKVPLIDFNKETNNYENLINIAPYSKLRFLRALEWKWIPEWNSNYDKTMKTINIGMNYSKPEKFPYIITETKKEIGQQLQDFIDAEYIKLITQSTNFNTDWNNFVKEYKNLGGSKLIQEMNEKINDYENK